MNTKKLIALALVLVLGVAAVTALAQDDGNGDDTWPFGHGPGMMFGNWDEHPMWDGVAEALGLDQDALFDELRSGKTLADIAEEQGVELETLQGVWLANAAEHMNALVEEGYLTQEQANARLEHMSENFAEGGFGCGMGFGGPGMMGRGGRGMHGGTWGGRMGPGFRGPFGGSDT